jgi:hypothetical protein
MLTLKKNHVVRIGENKDLVVGIRDMRLPIAVASKLKTAMGEIGGALKTIHEAQEKIMKDIREEYGKRDESGNLLMSGKKNARYYVMRPADEKTAQRSYQERLLKLHQETVEIPSLPVTLEELEGSHLTMQELSYLEVFMESVDSFSPKA